MVWTNDPLTPTKDRNKGETARLPLEDDRLGRPPNV